MAQGIQVVRRNLTEKGDSQTIEHVTDPQSLDVGDELVYHLSHQVNYNNGETMWVKVGSTTTVRNGEDAISARNRLVTYVHDSAATVIKEAIEHANQI